MHIKFNKKFLIFNHDNIIHTYFFIYDNERKFNRKVNLLLQDYGKFDYSIVIVEYSK